MWTLVVNCVPVIVFAGMQNCVSNRGFMSGTNLTALPVLSGQNAAVGLHNIQSQVENNTILIL